MNKVNDVYVRCNGCGVLLSVKKREAHLNGDVGVYLDAGKCVCNEHEQKHYPHRERLVSLAEDISNAVRHGYLDIKRLL